MGVRRPYIPKEDSNKTWNCIDCAHYWYPEEREHNRIRYCKKIKPKKLITRWVKVQMTHPDWCPLEGNKEIV